MEGEGAGGVEGTEEEPVGGVVAFLNHGLGLDQFRDGEELVPGDLGAEESPVVGEGHGAGTR